MLGTDNDTCEVCGGGTAIAHEYPTSRYRRCRACSMLTKPTEREHYDDEYFEDYVGGAYDANLSNRRREAAVRVAWVRRYGARSPLMEIGAASGYFVAAARSAGLTADGIEPAAGVAASARLRNGVDVQAQTLQDLARSGRRFETLCLWHVIEHLPDPVTHVGYLYDLLVPGGKLFAEVPNERSAKAAQLGEKWMHLDPTNHVRHYGPDSMTKLLTSAGFEMLPATTHRMTSYLPLVPSSLVVGPAAYALDSLRTRTLRPVHPFKHELLRVAARRPYGS